MSVSINYYYREEEDITIFMTEAYYGFFLELGERTTRRKVITEKVVSLGWPRLPLM
jgi:hypothetical protein